MTQNKRNLGKIKGCIVGIQYYDAEATAGERVFFERKKHAPKPC